MMSPSSKTLTSAPHVNEVLHIEKVVVRYGSNTVVSSASFGALPGELLAISGRSGAGKSSLLYSIAGLIRPASGLVRLDGIDLASLSERELTKARRKIGFVFQDAALLNEIDVLDNIAWVGRLRGLSLREARTQAGTSLESLGVSHLATRMPGEISGGEAQRVNIARALTGNIKLLLVDEPTAALDEANSVGVCQILAKISAQTGVATVVVSHDPIVIAHAGRCLAMVDGVLT